MFHVALIYLWEDNYDIQTQQSIGADCTPLYQPGAPYSKGKSIFLQHKFSEFESNVEPTFLYPDYLSGEKSAELFSVLYSYERSV